MCRPRNPQKQGQIERANQTISKNLAKCLFNKKRWIDVLTNLVFKCTTTRHRETNFSSLEGLYDRTGINKKICTWFNYEITCIVDTLSSKFIFNLDDNLNSELIYSNPVQLGM